MQGELKYKQQKTRRDARRFGSIMLNDAYEVHQFVSAQDMFTTEQAIDLVIEHNQAVKTPSEIPVQAANKNDIPAHMMFNLNKVLELMGDLPNQYLYHYNDKADNPQRVDRGSIFRTAAIHTPTQTTHPAQTLCSDEYAHSSPQLMGLAVYGPLAPSFYKTE